LNKNVFRIKKFKTPLRIIQFEYVQGMNILICPDKFKGSLNAPEVSEAIEEGIRIVTNDSNCTVMPLADGGDGSLAVLQSVLNLQNHKAMISDPLGRKVESEFCTTINGEVAFIEMAQASGLQLLEENERRTKLTTSYGTGELIFNAINLGVRKVVLMVGGSATTDGGIGMMAALGYQFIDEKGKPIQPIGESLIKISKIIPNQFLSNISFEILTDVDNPLTGKNGAAYVYAPQKGASPDEVAQLDAGLHNLSSIITRETGKNISQITGAGAAGGVSALLLAYRNAQIKSGIYKIMEYLHFEKQLIKADLVITGEGKLDEQTFKGKVVKGVLDRALKMNKQVIVVCGNNQLNYPLPAPFDKVKINSLSNDQLSLEYCMKNARSLVVDRTIQAIKETVI